MTAQVIDFLAYARKELASQEVAKNIADEQARLVALYQQGVQAMASASNMEMM